MAETVLMPKLGFDMQEGLLVRWAIAEGGPVQKGDVLAEIETDKATVEVQANSSGIVIQHLVEEGTAVPVGTPIAVLAAPGEEVKRAEKSPVDSAPQTVQMPAAVPEQPQKSQPIGDEGRVKASPLARKVAADHQLPLSAIPGSGPGGRIVRRDVEAAVLVHTLPASLPASPAANFTALPANFAALPANSAALPAQPMPAFVSPPAAGDQVIPLDRLRAAIGRRMLEAKQQIPHFYVTHEYDVEPLLQLRSQLNALLPEEHKLTLNDFLIKAVALTLRQFPNLNSSLQGGQIRRHAQIQIGVAVSLEGGLMTVVSRNADQKALRQLSAEMKELVARARAGKVRPEDIEGSTFSISNLGMYQVEQFAAIINPPEAAILAVGSARQVPVVAEGRVQVGTRMKMTLSVDHRVSDGAEAAQFLQALEKVLLEPLRLVI